MFFYSQSTSGDKFCGTLYITTLPPPQEARRELTTALLDELAEERPVRDLITELRDMAVKHSIPDHEIVGIVSLSSVI